jgi:hypothetical protein
LYTVPLGGGAEPKHVAVTNIVHRIRGYTVPVDFNLDGAEACDSHMQLRVHVYTSDDA